MQPGIFDVPSGLSALLGGTVDIQDKAHIQGRNMVGAARVSSSMYLPRH